MTGMTGMTGARATRRLRALGTLGLGMALGGLVTVVGLAEAGRLAPEQPEVLVPLAQTLDVEHRRVDLMLERGEVADAIAALEALRTTPWPSRMQGGDTAVALRHDAYGRLVRMRLDHPDVDAKQPEELLAVLDEALGEEGIEDLEANPFTARLYALRGELLEELGRDDEALAAYEAALAINRVLLEKELGGPKP